MGPDIFSKEVERRASLHEKSFAFTLKSVFKEKVPLKAEYFSLTSQFCNHPFLFLTKKVFCVNKLTWFDLQRMEEDCEPISSILELEVDPYITMMVSSNQLVLWTFDFANYIFDTWTISALPNREAFTTST